MERKQCCYYCKKEIQEHTWEMVDDNIIYCANCYKENKIIIDLLYNMKERRKMNNLINKTIIYK